MIDYNELKNLADDDTFCAIVGDTGIVRIRFAIGGALWSCQFDSDNVGIYALHLQSDADMGTVLRALRAAADSAKEG